MPTSFSDHVPLVCHVVQMLQPKSVLDVGAGFGKWGHMFREILDIGASGDDPARYHRENWKVRIDGIEGHAPYITPMHQFLYNNIYQQNMLEAIDQLGQYDVIFMGDVIEHVPKDVGADFLRKLLAHANKAVIVSTPAFDIVQENVCDNPLETHRSFWRARDFKQFGNVKTVIAHSRVLVAILLKPGVAEPSLPNATRAFVKRQLLRLRRSRH